MRARARLGLRLPAQAEAFEAAQTLSSGGGRAPPPSAGADGTAIVVYADGPDGARVLRAAGGRPGPRRSRILYDLGHLPHLLRPHGPRATGSGRGGPRAPRWRCGAASTAAATSCRRAERLADGTFAGAQTRSSTATDASATDPAVALDAAGGAMVAWTHDANAGDAGNPTQVRWSERPAGGGFALLDQAVDPPAGDAPPTATPDLAAAADGTVVGGVAGSGDERTVQRRCAPPAARSAATRRCRAGRRGVPRCARTARARRARHVGVGDRDSLGPPLIRRDVRGRADRGAGRGRLRCRGRRAGGGDRRRGQRHRGVARCASPDSVGVQVAGYDAAPPTVTVAAAGGAGVARVPPAMRAAAVDRWSPVSYAWSFGDAFAAARGPAHLPAAGLVPSLRSRSQTRSGTRPSSRRRRRSARRGGRRRR